MDTEQLRNCLLNNHRFLEELTVQKSKKGKKFPLLLSLLLLSTPLHADSALERTRVVASPADVGTGNITLNGENLQLAQGVSLRNNIVFNGSSKISVGSGLNASLTGQFTGAGGWTKAGNGSLTFVGKGNYVGATNLNTGVVATSGENPFGLGKLSLASGNLEFVGNTSLNNSSFLLQAPTTTFTVAPHAVATIHSSMTGHQQNSLIKQGPGTLVLNGNNSYSGPTRVSEGTLVVNGDLSKSKICVEKGAVLQGTGHLGPTSVLGTLAPGNPTGTLDVADIRFEDHSSLKLTINGDQFTALHILGKASIGKDTTLHIDLQKVTQPFYPVLNAAGPISGGFTRVVSNASLRKPLTLLLADNQLALVFDAVPFPDLLPMGNLQNIGFCFEQLAATPPADLIPVLNVLDTFTTESQFQAAFDQFDPALYNAISLVEQYAARTTRWIFSRHIYDRQFDPKFLGSVWVDPFAGRADQDNAGGGQALSGYHDNLIGAVGGVDFWLGPVLLSGGGSYGRSLMRWTDANHAKARVHSYTGFLGLTLFAAPALFEIYGSYTRNCGSGSRDIYIAPDPSAAALVPPVDRHVDYKNQSSLYTSHIGLLSTIPLPNSCFFTLAFGNIDYYYLSQQPFTERGAGSLDLRVLGQTNDLLQPEIGLGIGFSTPVGGKGSFISDITEGNFLADFRVSYVKNFRFTGENVTANFVGNGCRFTTRGLFQNDGFISPSLHVLFSGIGRFDLSFDVEGLYWGRYVETTGKMEFIYVF